MINTLLGYWYVNSVSILISLIVLFAIGYIFFTRKQGSQFAIWLGMGFVALLLTLPANLITFQLTSADRVLLDKFLSNRDIVESIIGALDKIANDNNLDKFSLDIGKNLDLFLYLSLAGLLFSIVAAVGHFINTRSSQDYSDEYETTGSHDIYEMDMTENNIYDSQPIDSQPTTKYSSQQPNTTNLDDGGLGSVSSTGAFNNPMSFPPATPTISPRTEQIDMHRHGQPVSRQPMGAPPKTELLNVPAPSNAWLVVKEGDVARVGKIYSLSPDSTTIGRDASNCNVVLDGTAVSRQHAKVRLLKDEDGNNEFTIQDLATSNGTKVNGADIVKYVLEDGDEIKIGRSVLVFKVVK